MRTPQHFVTVDLLIVHPGSQSVLLIQRRKPPFEGLWALPGGHIEVCKQECPEGAARRELFEETGLDYSGDMTLLGVFGDPGRDPRGPYISILYGGLIDSSEQPKIVASDDAGAAVWWPLSSLPGLAFDHDKMLQCVPQLLATCPRAYTYCAIVVNDISGTEVIPTKSYEDALLYLRDRAQGWENPKRLDLTTATLHDLSLIFAYGEPNDTLMVDIGTLEKPWEPVAEATKTANSKA